MPKYFFSLLLTMGLTLSTVHADSTVEQALLQTTSYPISGSFSPYDFAPKGDNNPFDWAYTVRSTGTVYQLQGVAPTPKSVFGWKKVDTQSSAARPSTPMWYMFQLNGDIDGDGTTRFDWVLVSATGTKAVYKLAGVRENGTFKYSDKLNVDYNIVGNTVNTAAVGTFDTNSNVDDTNDTITENNATDTACTPLPQESIGQKSVLRVTKYYDTTSRYTDITKTVVSNNPTSTVITIEHQSNGITKTETLTTGFSITGNYKDITTVLSERTGLSPKTTTYAPYWREPINEVCENQTWSFNVNTTVGTSTTSENVTYRIVALNESKTVAGGTFSTVHIETVTNNYTEHQWIDTTSGALIYEEVRNTDGSLKESTEFLSFQ